MEPSKRELVEAVFAGDSELAARMRALDWSATLLGPVEEWPQALRTGVRIVLDSARALEQERPPQSEELRASEERLAEMSRRYRELQRTHEELQLEAGLLQQLPVSAWTLKPDGTPDFVNRVWLEFAGQTLEFVRSNPEAWMNAVHPEDRETASKAFWDGVRSGQGFSFENRSLRVLDGTYRWHLQQAVVLRDEEGKVLKFVGTTTDIDDQKRAEEALRESEHESRLIVDSIPGMVAVISTSGEVMFLSKPILDYYGKSLDEVNSQWTTGDMIHREDRPGLIQAFTRSLASGDPTEVELRARRFDGVYRWFDLRGRPLRDRHGQIVRWYFLQTDIDDRKRAEEKLREREHESRLIVDSIPGLIAVLDTSGEVERVNQPLLDYLGRSLEELRQWAVDDTIHPDDRPGYLQAFERAFATGDAVEYDAARIRRFDGVYRWLNIRGRPLRDREGHIVRWYFLLTEVDDRKRAEEKLRESEYESRLIVDSIPGLIAVLGASGELERLNQPMLDYLGKSLEESRQWAVDGTVHPDDRPAYLQTFAESFAAGVPFEYEAVRTRRFDGVYRWLNMRGLPLRDRQGHIVRWYFLLADVDDRKRAEEALRQAQRDLARISRVTTMGELAASLAHEVSQPISGTMTNANACLRSLGSDRPDVDLVRTAVTRIVRDAQRAVEIIGRIRSQFEKGAPDREVIDVNEVNRETVALLRDEAIRYNILVRTELAADLPQIVGDRVQLQQVVMNLIVNSIDAMKEVEGMREMVIASQPAEDGQILVSVSDTGIGLPQQLAERIFDPFFTTKPHGTGMGLRISRSIIESHGGRLWAVGSSGRGATFHLKLPAAVPDMRTGAGGTA